MSQQFGSHSRSHSTVMVALLVLTQTLFTITASADQAKHTALLPVTKAAGFGFGMRLYVFATKVGNLDVDVPLLFDTGSAATSIECRELFSPTICNTTGINSRDVKGSGIRVTSSKVDLRFESIIEHTQLAYAKLSFGMTGNDMTTEVEVPFLIRLSETDRATGAKIETGHKGVLGASPIDATNVQTGGLSVLRSIDVGPDRKRGFILKAVGVDFRDCANYIRSCPHELLLQIGIGPGDYAGFSLVKAKRPAARWPFAATTACLSFDGKKVCRPTLFDTGSAKSIVASRPTGSSTTLPDSEAVSIESSSFDTFQLKPTERTPFEFAPNLPFNVIGVSYFMTHDFLIDYEGKTIGFGELR